MPRQIALVQTLTDKHLDDRLPADIQFGCLVQFVKHGLREVPSLY